MKGDSHRYRTPICDRQTDGQRVRHDVLHCRQKWIESQITCTENLVKFRREDFEIRERTDQQKDKQTNKQTERQTQTDTLTDTLIAILCTPTWG